MIPQLSSAKRTLYTLLTDWGVCNISFGWSTSVGRIQILRREIFRGIERKTVGAMCALRKASCKGPKHASSVDTCPTWTPK